MRKPHEVCKQHELTDNKKRNVHNTNHTNERIIRRGTFDILIARSASVEATETVATNFVRLGDEGEGVRIRLGDYIFDFVDLAF